MLQWQGWVTRSHRLLPPPPGSTVELANFTCQGSGNDRHSNETDSDLLLTSPRIMLIRSNISTRPARVNYRSMLSK